MTKRGPSFPDVRDLKLSNERASLRGFGLFSILAPFNLKDAEQEVDFQALG